MIFIHVNFNESKRNCNKKARIGYNTRLVRYLILIVFGFSGGLTHGKDTNNVKFDLMVNVQPISVRLS